MNRNKSTKKGNQRNNRQPKRNGQGIRKDKDCDTQTEKPSDQNKDKDSRSGRKSLPGNNDVAWYTLDPTILKDAASYPFSNPVGSRFQTHDKLIGAPGIMVIEYEPSYGRSYSASSPINLAAMKFYSFVRQANSGSKNYESSDLMMYFMAVTNLFSALAHFRRCYGLIGVYSNYNMYLGKPLVNALGMDYTVLRAHQADLRRMFNTLVDQINMSLHIPMGLKISERHVFCNSGVFVDAPGRKFQLYVLKQKHYFKFDATTYATGSALIGDYPEANGEEFSGSPTVDPYDYLNWIDGLISQLVANEDINIMSGDILKAYGDAGCYKLGYLDEQYVTPILNDVMMLSQIHNIQSNFDREPGFFWKTGVRKTGQVGDDTEAYVIDVPTVVQDGNVIIHHPYAATKNHLSEVIASDINLLLDIPVESPTPADVMESTRLMAMADHNDVMMGPNDHEGNPIPAWGIIAGSEIVKKLKIVSMAKQSQTGIIEPVWFPETISNICDKNDLKIYSKYVTSYVMAVGAFDWHPLMIVTDSTQNSVDAYIGDISNFTILDVVNMESLHSAAIYGEFDVPVKTV